jgi:hypothetical protein
VSTYSVHYLSFYWSTITPWSCFIVLYYLIISVPVEIDCLARMSVFERVFVYLFFQE